MEFRQQKREAFASLFVSLLELLLDLGTLAHAVTQIIQLCAANSTVADHFDVIDGRRMDREHLLHADAIGQTTDSDGLLDAAVLICNDNALEDLDTLTSAFVLLEVVSVCL